MAYQLQEEKFALEAMLFLQATTKMKQKPKRPLMLMVGCIQVMLAKFWWITEMP